VLSADAEARIGRPTNDQIDMALLKWPSSMPRNSSVRIPQPHWILVKCSGGRAQLVQWEPTPLGWHGLSDRDLIDLIYSYSQAGVAHASLLFIRCKERKPSECLPFLAYSDYFLNFLSLAFLFPFGIFSFYFTFVESYLLCSCFNVLVWHLFVSNSQRPLCYNPLPKSTVFP
jgi:hypothetical protein